jgi:hypothetical protein
VVQEGFLQSHFLEQPEPLFEMNQRERAGNRAVRAIWPDSAQEEVHHHDRGRAADLEGGQLPAFTFGHRTRK